MIQPEFRIYKHPETDSVYFMLKTREGKEKTVRIVNQLLALCDKEKLAEFLYVSFIEEIIKDEQVGHVIGATVIGDYYLLPEFYGGHQVLSVEEDPTAITYKTKEVGSHHFNNFWATHKHNKYLYAMSVDALSMSGPPAYNGTFNDTKDPGVKMLPGLKERVVHPVKKVEAALESVIVDLNDSHKWTREQIADWIETLDIDTTFKIKEKNV